MVDGDERRRDSPSAAALMAYPDRLIAPINEENAIAVHSEESKDAPQSEKRPFRDTSFFKRLRDLNRATSNVKGQGARLPEILPSRSTQNDTQAKTQEARRKTTRALTEFERFVDYGTFDDAISQYPEVPGEEFRNISRSPMGLVDSKFGGSIGRSGLENPEQSCEKLHETISGIDYQTGQANGPKKEEELQARSGGAATSYSDTGSVGTVIGEIYVSAVVDAILKELDYKYQDPQELEIVSYFLPDFLQAFASKAGYRSSSEELLSILDFINTHRKQIARSFRERVLPIEKWEEEDDSGENLKADRGKTTAEFIRQRQDGLDLATDPGENVGLATSSIDLDESVWLSYLNIIVGTPEFDWLIGKFRAELILETTGNNAMRNVFHKIRTRIRYMERFQRLDQGHLSEAFQASFEVDCDIFGFIRSQKYEVKPHEAIVAAVTLTGTILDAQACTCSQYMRQTWPTTGIATLKLFQDMVAVSGAACECYWSDGTYLKAWTNEKKIAVEVTGVDESIAEVGEQLSWLGSTLRPSPHESGVAICSPLAHVHIGKQLHLLHFANDQSASPFTPDIFCQLSFKLNTSPVPPQPVQGQCWQSMFRNQIVVEDFPILRRDKPGTGLEIPLDVMARLIDTRRIDVFDGKFFLKGFSSMLVPTAQLGDLVLWHHIYNKSGDRISYLNADVDHLRGIDRSQLEKARHVVGWSSEIRCLAGAADAKFSIERSRLPQTGSGCVLEKVSISGGKFVTGSVGIGIGIRDKPVHIQRNGYISRLQWISQRYVVFWDVQARRGWLVNGTNALLHIVRASLHHNKSDDFETLFLFDPESLKEADITHTTKSAIDVLTNQDNMLLELYPDKPQQEIKTVHKRIVGGSQDPPSEAVTEDKRTFYRLQDRVDEIYNVLEKIIDHQIDAAGQSGVKLSAKARKHLEGWDFKDLATNRDPVHPRVAKLSTMGYGWVDFTRAIQAITLFGKGFGELIQPEGSSNQCKKWSRVPEGRYYLVAAVSDMRKIMDLDGDPDANPMKVCESLIWYNPVTPFGSPCLCERDPSSTVHSDPVQVLFPSRMHALLPRKPPIKLGNQGGVIFGHNLNYTEWHYGDRGEPVRVEMPISEEAEDAASDPHDSGVGSSLQTSTTGASHQIASSASSSENRSPAPASTTRGSSVSTRSAHQAPSPQDNGNATRVSTSVQQTKPKRRKAKSLLLKLFGK